MFATSWLAIAFLFFLLSSSSSSSSVQAFGIQSGPDNENSFAGGMVYDPQNGAIYLTGATYGDSFFSSVTLDALNHSESRPQRSNDNNDDGVALASPYFCFVASVSFPTSSSSSIWGQLQRITTDAAHPQSCTSLTYTAIGTTTTNKNKNSRPGRRPELYYAGYQVQNHRTIGISVSGVLYELDASSPRPESLSLAIGGGSGGGGSGATTTSSSSSTSNVIFPRAIVTETNDTTTALYVTSIFAQNTSHYVNESLTTLRDDTLDPTTNFLGAAFATSFAMNVQKWVRPANNFTAAWTTEWNQSYATHNGESVHVSSMIYLPKSLDGDEDDVDMILVAGYTTGFGLAFGANGRSTSVDGFVTKFHAGTGLLPMLGDTSTTTTETQFGASYSTRISSQTNRNDFVMGLCRQESRMLNSGGGGGSSSTTTTTTTADPLRHVYVVGTTFGKMAAGNVSFDGGAFLMQLEVETLTPSWVQQVSGVEVEGIACAVTPDGQHVYLGGNFQQGTALHDAYEPQEQQRRQEQERQQPRRNLQDNASPTTSTTTNTDIFVAQFLAQNGSVTWIQSIGTPDEDESLAEGNTGGLAVDEDGNVYVYGNTQGSLFRNNTSGTNDVFVAFLSRLDGSSNKSKKHHGIVHRTLNARLLIAVVVVAMILFLGLFLAFTRIGKGSRTAAAAVVVPDDNGNSSNNYNNESPSTMRASLPAESFKGELELEEEEYFDEQQGRGGTGTGSNSTATSSSTPLPSSTTTTRSTTANPDITNAYHSLPPPPPRVNNTHHSTATIITSNKGIHDDDDADDDDGQVGLSTSSQKHSLV